MIAPEDLNVVLCQRQIAIDGRGGGLGTLYANLAAALAAEGVAVTLLTATPPEKVGVGDVTTVSLPDPSPDPVAYACQVNRALDDLRFHLAECASWKAELAIYAARRPAYRAPVVVRGELPAPVLDPNAETLYLEESLIEYADAVLPVSQTVADLIQAHYRRKPDRIVHNAVDTRVFHPPPPGKARRPGPLRVLWVGSHAPVKRLDHLQAIVSQTPDARFEVVLPWREDSDDIAALSAAPNVRLHHGITQDGMAQHYRDADLLLSTSRLEAFGLGILEAMACGTPVLVPRDIGGATEFVREGQDGYYYDSPDDAADRLAGDPTIWGRFGAAMIEHAQGFSWARCVKETLEAYQQVLKS